MTEGEAKSTMERHGITAAQRTVYHYQGHSYGNLADALNYAELVAGRTDALAAPEATRTDRG